MVQQSSSGDQNLLQGAPPKVDGLKQRYPKTQFLCILSALVAFVSLHEFFTSCYSEVTEAYKVQKGLQNHVA